MDFSTFSALIALFLLCRYFAYYIIHTLRLSEKSRSKLPPWLPYILPGLGHSLWFLTKPFHLLKCIKHPVRLRLPGMNPYLIQGVPNVRRLLKAASDTNPAHAQNFIASQLFGMPKSAAKLFKQDDSGYGATPRPGSQVLARNRICFRDRKLLMDMLQGPELAGLIQRFERAFDKRLGALAVSEEWVELPDFWEFLTTHVTHAAIEAICGPALIDTIDGDFVRDFWRFDSWVPAITKGAPSWLFPCAYSVRDKLLDSLVRWRKLSLRQPCDGEGTGATASMQAKMDLLEVDGWSVEAIAASDLGLIWASNSNTISAVYWLNVEIFRSRERLRRVRAECLTARGTADSPTALESSPLHPDLPSLLAQPYLQACFAEMLRLRTHIFITRFVDTHNMDINGWTIPARSVAITCSSVPHMDTTLWNKGTVPAPPLGVFSPERFLKTLNDPSCGPTRSKPEDVSSVDRPMQPASGPMPYECTATAPQQFSAKGLDGIWIPFGGGAQMCPGRKLAKAETFIVTAALVTLFDIELCNPEREIPVKGSHFGTGVSKPAAKTPFRIRRRRAMS